MEENVKIERKKSYKYLKVIAVITAIICLAVTVFLTIDLVKALSIVDVDKRNASLAVFLIFGVIILGSIGYAIVLVASLICLIISIVYLKKNILTKGWVIYYSVLTVLPVILEAFFIIICSIA
jgi:hypothetical protein